MSGRRRAIALLAVALLVLASCSSDGGNPIFGGGSDSTGTTATGGTSSGDGSTTTTADTQPGGGDPFAGGGDEDDYRPVPIREGLGTFDNYEWEMSLTTVGPTAAERTVVTTFWSYNADPLSHYSSISTDQEGPDFDGVESSTTEIYRVENDTCQFDGETWTYTGATDQQAEVLELTQRLVDFTIVPESPVEIGEETVGGIPATHWQYTVAGFGSDSGALVTENQVDYWVARDTGVLLRYSMVVESRSGPSSDPDAEVYRVETSMELVSANQFVPIDLPAGCLQAKADSEADG